MVSTITDGLAPQELTERLLGPASIGTSLLLLCSGTFLQQSLTLLRTSSFCPSRSSRSTRLAIFGTVLLLGGYAACVWATDYEATVSQARKAHELRHLSVLANVVPVLNGVVVAWSHSFLLKRAGKTLASRPSRLVFLLLTGGLILLGFTGSALVSAIGLFTREQRLAFSFSRSQATALWLSASALASLLTSVVLARALRTSLDSSTNRSIWARIDSAIASTAVLPTVVALGAAVSSLALTNGSSSLSRLPSAFYLPLPALFAISLLASLFPPLSSTSSSTSHFDGLSTPTALILPTLPHLPALPLQSATSYLPYPFHHDSSSNYATPPPPLPRKTSSHSRRVSSFRNSLISAATGGGFPPSVPTASTTAAATARRLSGKFDVKVTTEVEQTVEDSQAFEYEELMIGLGKEKKISNWLMKGDEEDEHEKVTRREVEAETEDIELDSFKAAELVA